MRCDIHAVFFSHRQGAGRAYCSLTCRWPPRSIADRFWEKVDKRGPDECWPWRAGQNGLGYGIFVLPRNVHIVASRFALQQASGSMGIGRHCCHVCDTPTCVNPDHLFWGTQADNMRDARMKGRTRGGPQKTHCVNGHEFTPENTAMVKSRGHYLVKSCRECARASSMRSYNKDILTSRARQNERNRIRKSHV